MYKAIIFDFLGVLSDEDPKMIDLVRRLKEKYKIGLCSNTSSSYIKSVLKKTNLEELFDAIIISGEVNLSKSSPEIYELLLRKLSVVPEESIFIDDDRGNLEEAEAIGIKGILFKNAEQLSEELDSLLK